MGSPRRTHRPPPPSRACVSSPKGWALGGDRRWSLGNRPRVMKVPGRDLGAGAEHEVPGGHGLGALHPKHTPNAGPGLLAADKPIGGFSEPQPAPGQLQGGSAWAGGGAHVWVSSPPEGDVLLQCRSKKLTPELGSS